MHYQEPESRRIKEAPGRRLNALMVGTGIFIAGCASIWAGVSNDLGILMVLGVLACLAAIVVGIAGSQT